MSKYKYEAGGIIRDLELDIPYHTDDIVDLLTGKDLHITELQKKLEEKEKGTKYWHNLYQERDKQFQSVRQRYYLLNRLQSNYDKKDKLHLVEMQCSELIEENKNLKQQLHSQPAEIVEKIYEYLTQEENWKQLRKVWLNNGECEYLRKSLDTILKEYQK